MTDANWWNTYFVRTTTQSGSPRAEQELEEYWLLRYAEITGSDGAWEYNEDASVDVGGCCCCCGSFAVLILCLLALIYWLHWWLVLFRNLPDRYLNVI